MPLRFSKLRRPSSTSNACSPLTPQRQARTLTDLALAYDQDGDLVEPANFPLPTLGPKLKVLSQDIHYGKGFGVIRGLDPASYSVEDLTLIYLGVQSYIAEQRGRQDKRGNMLGVSAHLPLNLPDFADEYNSAYCRRQQHKADC